MNREEVGNELWEARQAQTVEEAGPDEVTDEQTLQEKREAWFAELNALNKGQLARIITLQAADGSLTDLAELMRKKTKAELVWLLVDAKMPMARDPAAEEEAEVKASAQREWLAKEAKELEEAKELKVAQKEIAKQRKALEQMFNVVAKPNKVRRRTKRSKQVPITAELTPVSGPLGTQADLKVALGKVALKDGRPVVSYVGGRKGRTTFPWSYVATYWVDPVAWANAKRVWFEVTTGKPWGYRTVDGSVVFEPCPLLVFDPGVQERLDAILEEIITSGPEELP